MIESARRVCEICCAKCMSDVLLCCYAERIRQREQDIASHMLSNQTGESVEWVNMCFRKIWRVYQRGLEHWITDLLQPVFDGLVQVSRGGGGG